MNTLEKISNSFLPIFLGLTLGVTSAVLSTKTYFPTHEQPKHNYPISEELNKLSYNHGTR